MKYGSLEDPRPVTLLLMGINTAGKTYNSTRIDPTGTVLFDFDRNSGNVPDDLLGRICPGDNCEPAMIWDKFEKLIVEIAADPDVRIIVIDSITTLSQVVMWKLQGGDNVNSTMNKSKWPIFKNHFAWIGGRLLAAQNLDKHIIFCAHEEPVVDDEGIEKSIRLLMPSSLKNSYGGLFNNIWRCYMNGTQHLLSTKSDLTFRGRCDISLPDRLEWDKDRGLVTDAFNNAMALVNKTREIKQEQEQDKEKK